MAAVMYTVTISLVILLSSNIASCENDTRTLEVCTGEKFQPDCKPGDVIIIQAAEYGRMDIGRCITTRQEHMGCGNDVLPQLEKWCSGRKDCSPLVPNPELDAANDQCLEYLRLYLNISYRCVKAAPLAPEVCHNASSLNLSGREGFIPSLLAHETGCVTKSSPAIIQGEKGQKIQFTLLDFSFKETRTSIVYGNIVDRSTNVNKTIYGGSTRTTEVYTSGSHIAEVILFYEEKTWAEVDPFVLQYTVIGCPEPVVPGNAWYVREGNDATVGCNWGDESWTLRCKVDIWHGQLGNCTAKVAGSSFMDMEFWLSPIFLTTAVTSLVVLAVVMFVVGCICYRRKRFKGEQGVEVIPEVPNSPMPVRVDSRKPSQSTIDEEDELMYSVHVRRLNKSNPHPLREKPLPALPGETLNGTDIIPGFIDLCVDSRPKQNGTVSRVPEKITLQNADFQRPRLPDPSPPDLPDFDPPMEYEVVQVRSSGDFANSQPISEHTSATNPDTELLLPTRRRTSSVSSSGSSASEDSAIDQRESPSTQESACARSADSDNIMETPDNDPDDLSSLPPPPPPHHTLEIMPTYAEHTKPLTVPRRKADPPTPPVVRSASENDSLLDDSDSAPVPDLPRKSWLFEEPPVPPMDPTDVTEDFDTLSGLTADEALQNNVEPLIIGEATSPEIPHKVSCQNGECHYTNCEC